MGRTGLPWGRSVLAIAGAMALALAAGVQPAAAKAKAERYVPTIWVDPDGCEHWVMDDGHEGYMSSHLTRDGMPVCHIGTVCAILSTDTLFETDSFKVSAEGRRQLADFFFRNNARGYIISGHTDARASDGYNMALSQNRANAVAAVARASGARIKQVVAYGERKPRATNRTAEGMAQNRRVEIMCVK